MDGINFTLGARLAVGDRVEFGAALETPLEVSGNILTESQTGAIGGTVEVQTQVDHGVIRYPRAYRGGLTLKPRSDPRTVFTADAVYTEWADLEDDRSTGSAEGSKQEGVPLRLENTVEVAVGVQHLFYNGVPVRFGFRHMESYTDSEARASFFTAGIGMPTDAGTVSVSLEVSKISSVQEHFFSYPAGFVAAEISRVEDTRFRLGVGFTRNF
jgi:hypothetical protein